MEENKIDFGSVGIHQRAIADIVVSAIRDVSSVSLIPKNFKSRFLEFVGKQTHSGIAVTIDRDRQIAIEINIEVRYGVNIADTAQQVQSTVKLAIERMADVDLKEIRVNVQGVKRDP
ncbi:MAG: Asp23/Gls24 family envelope stress response protein [Candidatus Omnitrophota bacterium]